MSVASLISDARGYASGIISDADLALYNAQLQVMQVGYEDPSYTPVTFPTAPNTSGIDLTLPILSDVTLEVPAEPASILTFQDISPIEAGTLPVFNAIEPTITLPTAPNQLAEFTQTSPTIVTDFVFPEPPSVLLNPLIEAPTIEERAEPSKPQVALPAFSAVAPVDTTSVPTDLAADFESAYRDAAPSTIAMVNGYVDAMLAKHNPRYHEQMAAIEAQLSKYMAGGTGLSASVENAIYERAKTKTDAEARRVRETAIADMAGRGFTLPNGALVSAIQQARQAGADNNAQAAREITVMQAEMEQKNLQFAVTTSAALRSTMLNATLSYMQNLTTINGQALDYAKSMLSSLIESYNISVKAFGVKLDAYKAEAAVYETRLKSAMAGIELYKVEIQALEAMTQVDKSKVDVYRARIESLTSLSNVYKAQIDAVMGRASLEKLKLEMFQSQVQTYSAQVQGKNAEWQGYKAAIEGQTAKASIFSTQVQSYAAQVNGYKAGIEAKSEVIKAQAMTNDARARQFAALLSGYKTVVDARGEVARTKLENQRQTVVAFQAKTQAAVSFAQVQNEYYKAASSVAIQNADLQLRASISGATVKQAYMETMASLGLQSAKIYGSLASSAMAGMNTLSAETQAT